MGYFSRAFASCVNAAKLSQAEIAAVSGVAQSTISRTLQGDFMPEFETLEGLLRAFTDESDRMHCQRAYILDHTLEEFRGRVHITFGAVQEEKQRPKDPIAQALEVLDREANDNPALRQLLTNLADLMGPETPSTETPASFGSSVDDLLKRSANWPGPGAEPKPAATPRVVQGSSRPKRDSKQ